MKVYFVTPTRISYIDLITMGGSEKAGDESKIGQFASGLKYAMALMLRNDVNFQVEVIINQYPQSTFTIGEYTIEDKGTLKSKKLISITEDTGSVETVHHTGFSVDLGVGWSLWMVLREIFSNMKDEGGYYTESFPNAHEGTVMTLEFNEDSAFWDVWQNRHLYINEQQPAFKVSNSLDAYDNPEKYLKIFKQGVLVYEDRERYSEWAWGIHFGEIDERRLLNNVTGVLSQIADEVAYTNNSDFITEIVKGKPWVTDGDFLNDSCFYGSISEELRIRIYQIHALVGEVYTYKYLYEKAKDYKDSPLPGRVVRSLGDHLWNSSRQVTINDSKVEIEEKLDEGDLKSQIEKAYKISITALVKTASISGSEVIADKHNQTILVGEEFDHNNENHFSKFLIQYIDLTQAGNLLENLSKMLVQNLKR